MINYLLTFEQAARLAARYNRRANTVSQIEPADIHTILGEGLDADLDAKGFHTITLPSGKAKGGRKASFNVFKDDFLQQSELL